MKRTQTIKFLAVSAVLGSALAVLVGCGGPGVTPAPASTGSAAATPQVDFKPDVDAGVEVTIVADPAKLAGVVASKNFPARSNPFAMLGVEQAFDRSQMAERLSGEAGWSMRFEPPVEQTVEEEIAEEPQPYRRLAGVLVGENTVMAIMIMEDGRAEIIRPGMMVPGTEWRVVSIDEEKAVLRRAGNRRPRTITINLESGLGSPGGAAGGGGRGNAGGQPGAGGRGGGRGAVGVGGEIS